MLQKEKGPVSTRRHVSVRVGPVSIGLCQYTLSMLKKEKGFGTVERHVFVRVGLLSMRLC